MLFFTYLFLTLLSVFQVSLINVKTIHASGFESDNLGNWFFLQEESLVKCDTSLNVLSEYKTYLTGKPDIVDVSNPFKILIYYRNYNQVKFLDNRLSLLGDELNLDAFEIYNADLLCTSSSGGFWVFDNQANHLVHFNKNLTVSIRSKSLSNLLPENMKPSFITEKNNMIYLGIPEKGIYMFDNAAVFIRILPVYTNVKPIVEQNNIYYIADDSLWLYNNRNNQTLNLLKCRQPVCAMGKYQNKIFLYSCYELFIYEINL